MLEFIEKERAHGGMPSSAAEIVISLVKYKGVDNGQLNISLSLRAIAMLSDPKAIVIAADGDRLYLKPEDKQRGYSLSNKTRKRGYASIPCDRIPDPARFIGEYRLIFDGKYNLFCVDTASKVQP